MRDPYFTRVITDVKMTSTQFVSNAGGLLGLCMGFSAVSAYWGRSKIQRQPTSTNLDQMLHPVECGWYREDNIYIFCPLF